MDGARRQAFSLRPILFVAIPTILAGCLADGSREEVSVLPDFADVRLSGSVGDGPIAGASMVIFANDGSMLAEFESDAAASYDVTVRTRPRQYPLTISATGGIDMVTNLAPDFDLRSAVVEPLKKATYNINPYSTIALELATDLDGGISKSNIRRAESIVVTRLNFGLDTLTDTGPLSTEINDSNVAEIVRASEALGELIRRTRDALNAAGGSETGDDIVEAIGSDLTDEVLDGQGGPRADARIAAVASIAAAQVALETMANELHVNGTNANAAMRGAIEQISGSSPQTLGALRPTPQILYQARIGIAAAEAATGDVSLGSLLDAAFTLYAGQQPSLVRSQLPADYRIALDAALSSVASGNSGVVGDVNSMVRSGDPDPGTNQSPTINGAPDATVTANSPYSFVPTAFDPDGDTLNFSANGLPAWAAISNATGEISGTPDDADVGSFTGITITVSDGQASDTLGPFSIEVTPPPVTNNPPSINGTPPAAVQVNNTYSFRPNAVDPDGDNLSYSVDNLPSWASFNTMSGRINGTPRDTDVGQYSGILITVSDGTDSASLGPFSITVNAISLGSVTLNWAAPTQNTDGTPLTDLAGYKIYWGQNGNFSNSVAIDNPGITTYMVENLAPGSWQFVSTAYNRQGVESDFSNIATRQVQ